MSVACGTYYGATKCSSGPTPGARGAMSWYIGAYREEGGTNLGIYNCRAVRGGVSTSIHGVGRADDFGTPVTNTWSWDLVELLRLHSEELGIQGIIHRRKQWWTNRCDDGWTNYGGVAAHFDHIHLELTPEAAARAQAETAALWQRVLGDPSPIKGDGHVIAPPVVSSPTVGVWREIGMGAVSELGTKGEQVRLDQVNLVDTGFGVGPAGADGFFGQDCVDAARLFQTAAGITADGKVGSDTRVKLRQVPSYPGTGIRPYQARLAQRGWKIVVDGIPGPKTVAILASFQKEKGLSPDGKPGPMTWTALFTRGL